MLKKVLVTVGVAAAVSAVSAAIAYGVYHYMTLERVSQPTRRSIDSEEEEAENSEDDEKEISLGNIMDEAIVESMEYLNMIAESAAQYQTHPQKEEAMNALREKTNRIIASVETTVCQRHNMQYKNYIAAIKENVDKHAEDIEKRVEKLQQLVDTVLVGKHPSIEFPIQNTISAQITLLLYKWIFAAHCYIMYHEIRKYLAINKKCDAEQLNTAVSKLDDEKSKRRNRLVRRLKVPKQPGEDYRIVLQKAFFTYNKTDPIFDQDMKNVIKLHSAMLKKAFSKQEMPEMKNDPMKMSKDEFDQWYLSMVELYSKAAPAAINIDEVKKEEEKDVKIEEIKEIKETSGNPPEDVEVSNIAMDRMLRGERKKKKPDDKKSEEKKNEEEDKNAENPITKSLLNQILPEPVEVNSVIIRKDEKKEAKDEKKEANDEKTEAKDAKTESKEAGDENKDEDDEYEDQNDNEDEGN